MDPTKPVTAPFTKALPKIELHAHLSGSISRQCLHDLWLQKYTADPTFSLEDPLLAMPPGKVDYTLETLLGFGPDRLGHVIHVGEDIKREIVRRGVALELCISCNVHARLFEGGFLDHHFGHWRGIGECPVVLCTDDVGFFCSPVSNEYLIAAEHFDLTRADVVDICREGVRVIFGGEEEKKRLYRLLDEFEAGYRE